jgi:hypothetical protein
MDTTVQLEKLTHGCSAATSHRVFDLADAISKKWRPEDKLLLWKQVPNLKVLVCGGDGTMGWMFSCIDK